MPTVADRRSRPAGGGSTRVELGRPAGGGSTRVEWGRPARARHRTSILTSRGRGLVVAAAASAVAAHVFGITELDPVAAAAVVLVLSAVAWCWTRRWRIDVGRRLDPGRAEAGREVVVLITLDNRSDRTSPMLALHDPFDHGRRTTSLFVAPLAPGQRLTGSYRLPPTGRGVFTLGPLALETVDPLGLARRVRSSTVVSTLVVHPRVERLRPPRVGPGTERSPGTARAVPGRDNDEFSSLREYVPGDDIRRMHWASTARTDTLMVREDQLERRGQFSVLLDTRREAWTLTAFERAVSAAASIGAAALDAGLHARFVTTDGTDSGPGAGRPHRAKLLDLLAGVALRAPVAAGDADGERPAGPPALRGGTVVVVCSDRAQIEDPGRTFGVGPRAELVTVVIEESVSADPRRSGRMSRADGRVVRVGPGASLATVWDRLP